MQWRQNGSGIGSDENEQTGCNLDAAGGIMDVHSNRDPSLVPKVIHERSTLYANWVFTLTVSASDGYRTQSAEMTIRDGWSERDAADCLEALGMTAAGLIKAIENSGLAIYGTDAVRGFAEGYSDDEPIEPPAVPLRAAVGDWHH